MPTTLPRLPEPVTVATIDAAERAASDMASTSAAKAYIVRASDGRYTVGLTRPMGRLITTIVP